MPAPERAGAATPGRRSASERRAAADERRERRGAVTDLGVVMEAAAAYLAIRPRSIDEVHRRLRHLGYRADLREQAVARLVELGYLDDAELARAWIERRDRARPRGELALRRELLARGIPDALVAAALSSRRAGVPPTDGEPHGLDDQGREARTTGDEAAATRLLERRRAALEREPDPRKRRQKAYALLARNGFDPDLCQRLAGTFSVRSAAV
jgi:regulatory protein